MAWMMELLDKLQLSNKCNRNNKTRPQWLDKSQCPCNKRQQLVETTMMMLMKMTKRCQALIIPAIMLNSRLQAKSKNYLSIFKDTSPRKQTSKQSSSHLSQTMCRQLVRLTPSLKCPSQMVKKKTQVLLILMSLPLTARIRPCLSSNIFSARMSSGQPLQLQTQSRELTRRAKR